MGLDAAAPLTENAAWKELEVHYRQIKDIHLRRLLAEDPGRAERFTVEDVGITFDYSKNRITRETISLLTRLAESCGLLQRIEAMFSGEKRKDEKARSLHSFI